MKQRNKIIIVLITVVLVISAIYITGESFGFFRYVKKGEIVNIITINGIETEIISNRNPEENTVEGLTLLNAYPIKDYEGLSQSPFVFSMNNTASRSLSYTIRIVKDEEKLASCTNNGSSCLELTTNKIKFAYKKNDATYTSPALLSTTSGVVATGVINGKETVTSSILLWIDGTAGNEIMNRYFYGKVIIEGRATN